MTTGQRLSRRDWLVGSSLMAATWVSPLRQSIAQPPRSANEVVRFACIGVQGMGQTNCQSAAKHGDVVALCDVDESNLDKAAALYPGARKFFDFRKALEGGTDRFDAVVISTPNHTHAAIALMAMRMGKHVYCEKPLSHYLFEARQIAQVARTAKVVTQLGNQATAIMTFRRAIERIRQGIIGSVREVHAWTNRPLWPTGAKLSRATGNPPPGLHWDEWVGPAERTDYLVECHPFKWRGWWRFGNGSLGDMGAFILNVPFHALDLRNPATVDADHTGHDGISFPESATIRWQFPATPKRGPVTMFFYDGGRKPDPAILPNPNPNGGCLLVGTEGMLLGNSDYGDKWERIPGDGRESLNTPPDLLPISGKDHFGDFVDAIRGAGACFSNFEDVAGPLTEMILVGNLALLKKGTVNWDAGNLRVIGAPELATAIRPTYRAGYEL